MRQFTRLLFQLFGRRMIVNFGYVIDNELAGLAHPDSFGDVSSALDELHGKGIGALVSLDEDGIEPSYADAAGMRYLHISIPDFQPPQATQADDFVNFVSSCKTDGVPVAVHCRGGYGRTGTLIACYLISQGIPAREAIDTVRRRRPGSIETAGQERFLQAYETRLRDRSTR